MFLLNLSLAELAGLFAAVSGLVVVLYLLDRARRKIAVSTLRFWTPTGEAVEKKHRRRIQQPWSLLLQLISLLLLLLAIAQPRLGSPGDRSRNHVLILDTSAWMLARDGAGTLMDRARQSALGYVRALASDDRVMVVRADALASPATVFESNHAVVEAAIRRTRAGYSALHLDQAFDFAERALKMDGRGGEVVFVGAARVSAHDQGRAGNPPSRLRVLPLEPPSGNCGIRKIGLRRAPHDPGLWEVFIAVRNYGRRAREVPLAIYFGGAPAGTRLLKVGPGEEVSASLEFRTRAAGWLEARIESVNAIDEDNRATLELPGEKPLRVVVYSSDPAALRPILAASPRVEAVFRSPAEYQPDSKAGIVILDRFAPPAPPVGDSIRIEPPAAGSPVTVLSTRRDAPVTRWRTDHELGAGLRARDLRLESTEVFAPAAGDIVVAEVEGGPVVVARAGASKLVVLGFHPGRSALRYELTTPLLFANILRWMAPATFRRWELQAGSVGAVTATLDEEMDASRIKVTTDQQRELPFTVQGRTLKFFSGAPDVVRVQAGDREMIYSLSLPELAETRWEPPKDARRGLAGIAGGQAAPRDLWMWLAIVGGAGLLADWLVFGRQRGMAVRILRGREPRAKLWRRAS